MRSGLCKYLQITARGTLNHRLRKLVIMLNFDPDALKINLMNVGTEPWTCKTLRMWIWLCAGERKTEKTVINIIFILKIIIMLDHGARSSMPSSRCWQLDAYFSVLAPRCLLLGAGSSMPSSRCCCLVLGAVLLTSRVPSWPISEDLRTKNYKLAECRIPKNLQLSRIPKIFGQLEHLRNPKSTT
jgi:hypothetical protein